MTNEISQIQTEPIKSTVTVFELEKMQLPEDRWDEIPQCVSDALKQPVEDAANEVPLSIGHTELTGWFITMSGQGPFIYWIEYEDLGFYGYANDGRCDSWTRTKKE